MITAKQQVGSPFPLFWETPVPPINFLCLNIGVHLMEQDLNVNILRRTPFNLFFCTSQLLIFIYSRICVSSQLPAPIYICPIIFAPQPSPRIPFTRSFHEFRPFIG